ncbi:MAG TPA: hypothetical protein VNQ90_15585 [Chthoniobacteraceae bacterium]|nr:hypothetical protein [Chthoniobacteraceae bacterium]
MGTSTRIEGGFRTITVGSSAVDAYLRVKLGTDGKHTVCSATDFGDAITDEPIVANGTGTARFVNAPGQQFGIASGAVATAGLKLYAAADGKVSTTQSTTEPLVGISEEAAANGEVVTYTSAANTAVTIDNG